ncbi:MAG: ImmA/IrrE family metallo-endopeptidase [Thermoleophilia bacterium]|nr:ImmA/IrrE family metallo-endopeptidase [Thermoleophilia bacterium]
MDTDRVEAEARRVLESVPGYVWDGESLPVPVDSIVENVFGLLIRLVEDLSTAPGCEGIPPENLSGLLLTSSGEIWVNAEEARRWEGRRRFTIGHELGHHVMHRATRTRVFCRPVEVVSDEAPEQLAGARSVGGEQPLPELEANAFAAALMMPRHLMVGQCGRHGGDVDTLRAAFGSSEKAMKYRLDAMKSWPKP